ncbi:MAG: hypothetical protein PUC63_00025 [Clostridiales bacterium]|jgi:hypothetical protein|nr:hypothetical protein [Clostridiales bacterium]
MKENNETTADLSSLVDIRDVKVDRSLPVEDRIRSYVEQVKNPYCFRVGDVKVRVSFASNGRTLNDSFTDMLTSL